MTQIQRSVAYNVEKAECNFASGEVLYGNSNVGRRAWRLAQWGIL